ncbi:MAG: ATP-grasp domain-containing protein [Parvibaculum sp.]|uniref:ATP-grasp domain-containing protein n=1 Tax=Parvibaculum sp. TaxID=2024848 RepID=UPI003267E39A
MNRSDSFLSVMIAGVGGASLGTEISKCLALAGGYKIFGCDVSPTAYGLYDKHFSATFRVDRNNYIESVTAACSQAGAEWLVAGGEQPMALLSSASTQLAKHGIHLVANTPDIVQAFSDKAMTFERLSHAGITVPRTMIILGELDILAVGLPCIVKPATGSGGSVSVFFAITSDEAMIYADFIRRSGNVPIAQEYIPEDEGEFTIGVLSLPNGSIAGSIALKRALDAKLSVSYRGRGGLVSSGYSQGHIDDYAFLRSQAEHIAETIGSRGPINIQGRVKNGVLIPFEINPRFSASTYLRALAGFNEIDLLLRFMAFEEKPGPMSITPGWYLRSLTETYVPDSQIK